MSTNEPDNTPVPPHHFVRIIERLANGGVRGTIIRRLQQRKRPDVPSEE